MVKSNKKGFTLDIAFICLLCLLPLLWLIWRGYNGDLGVNPIETIVRQLGVWGLRLLIVGLAITPVVRIFKQPRLIRWRRPIGLFAFAYILLHLTSYIGIDQYFDWGAIWKDIVKRPYITFGMIGFVLLIPLAVTSFNGAIKAIGGRVWRNLHKLIYIIVPLGVLHYYLLAKADKTMPLIYGAILLILLGWRVVDAQKRGR
ncbi:protein-methionine-sulfoxide reductase heme-binding subunit MsrQ [Asticcacaulis sp. ZE23SCel15]|uniref:sulfite oxidase heme-binding subunit YedZ n=1 Tax=Asticcacaulis sp. ZE23SCel15 TaxID=3059027 RepID=UPI00265D7539|nr:protein-methionine-sulfoxide reductase heme-binding subunit MsrQ [Asticcacaulis sp. ZE23SCel15]WKL56285.1 protein-methionine-sulfoxide reductase heme-binding subunit MsrQ [Asticcacaulis sp. ZE23SCel15]